MSAHRYETKFNRARREARRELIVHIGVGLFLCLTIIGAPFGVLFILVGLHQHGKSMAALNAAQRDAYERVARKMKQEQMRIGLAMSRTGRNKR